MTNGLAPAEALAACLQAANDGAQATSGMLATKGRGRYQNENSIGHIDAGAISVTLIIQALVQACAA